MRKSKVTGFNVGKMKAKMLKNAVNLQTKLLANYARAKVVEIGNRIQQYHSLNHMDRTGNLLDSLCWGVTYDNKIVECGFFREQTASTWSSLHEYFSGDIQALFPVYGHGMAEEYLSKYSSRSTKSGWRVFFAILAPYWGYWEKGFTNKVQEPRRNLGETDLTSYSTRYFKFAVMTEFYDQVKQDLKPAKVSLRVHVEKYNTNRNNNLQTKRMREFWGAYRPKGYPTFKKKKV